MCFLYLVLVPLADFPQSVLEKVVELFYYGEVRVLTAFKGKVYKALAFLEVVDIKLPDPPKPRTKKTPESELLEILAIDGLSTSGTSGPQIGMHSVCECSVFSIHFMPIVNSFLYSQ